MLGLKRGTVRVCPHQRQWAAAFEAERQRVVAAAADLLVAIEHVGSTAVPGLPAKPIVDLAVAVSSFERLPALSRVLATLGWDDRGFINARRDDYLFVSCSAPDVRTHHMHVVVAGGRAWTEYLRFRDRLRTDAALRQAYAALKQRLVEQHSEDRTAYTAAKGSFIDAALDRTE